MRRALTLFLILLSMGWLSSAFADEPELAQNMVHYGADGGRFVLADFVQIDGEFRPIPGQEGGAILVFGAHWCVPCKAVVKYLSENKDALEKAKLHLIYVHVDDLDRAEGKSAKEIRGLVKKMAAKDYYEDLRVLVGGDMEEVRGWMGDSAFESLPAVVLINEEGEIEARFDGPKALQEHFDDLLSKSTPSEE